MLNLDDFDSNDDYAAAVQAAAIADPDTRWAIGGDDPVARTERQYAIEPGRGGSASGHIDDLGFAVDSLPDYRADARLVVREISYGPWRYVTPEEIRNA